MGRSALLGHLVLKVLDEDLPILVEHGEALPRHENRGGAKPTLALLRAWLRAARVSRNVVELVGTTLSVEADKEHVFLFVEDHRTSHAATPSGRTTDRHERSVLAVRELVHAHVAVFEEQHGVRQRRIRRSLPLKLEDNHPSIVTRGEKIALLVSGKDPKAVVLAAEGLHALAFRHVPHANGFILRIGDNQLLLGVKQCARHIVDVPAKSVYFPSFCLIHSPKLHLTIVRARDDQRQ
mmetsp:Transcript_20774/g.51886  ORF Transcript_20774/g.51886 Transcript_20774/m.51886 type:complete len:237 (-) Transcript_20774:756-1466(-)